MNEGMSMKSYPPKTSPLPQKPLMPHLSTTPDLHTYDEIKNNSLDTKPAASSKKYRLLDSLTTKHQLYETVVFESDKRINNAEKDYIPSIGFDDTATEYDEIPDENPFELNMDFLSRGRNLSRGQLPIRTSPSPTGNFLNPHASLTRALSPGPRMDYPTQSILTNKGCAYSKIHKDFHNLYRGKLAKPDTNETGEKPNKDRILRPVLRHRVILVFISGRKHTWVGLDWILNRYIENGDSVIVVAAINRFNHDQLRKKSIEPQRGVPISEDRRIMSRHRPENTLKIAKDIMTYMLRVLKPGVIAKLKVELSVGKTKDVLQEMYRLYEPNLVCVGSKSNSRTGAPLKSWTSLKLSDRLVKNFPLPLIVVPAVNMDRLEGELESQLGNTSPPHPLIFELEDSEDEAEEEHNKYNTDSETESDIDLILSHSSIESNNSVTSYDEISKLYINYKKDVHHSIHELKKRPRNEDYFQAFTAMISDKSIKFCEDVKDVDPDFKGKGARLARAITGSNKFGNSPYKTKSLLPPIEKPKLEGSTEPGSGMSYKEMKKMLRERQQSSTSPLGKETSQLLLPKVVIDGVSPSPPLQRTLKFADVKSPRSGSPKATAYSNDRLMKSLSHEINISDARPRLEPRKSHPDMELKESSVPDKKRLSLNPKKWKLFK